MTASNDYSVYALRVTADYLHFARLFAFRGARTGNAGRTDSGRRAHGTAVALGDLRHAHIRSELEVERWSVADGVLI